MMDKMQKNGKPTDLKGGGVRKVKDPVTGEMGTYDLANAT